MKKLKLFFALFAMLALGVGNAWAEDVTFSWSGSATADAGKTDYVVEQTPVTLTFAAGTAQNAPRTNKEGSVRMYANTTLTISCASGNITKVTFTPTNTSYDATKLKYNGTALTSGEWTLSSPSNEVTLTASANARFKTIVVTYTSAGSGETPEPDPDPTPDPEPEPDPDPAPGTGGTGTINFNSSAVKINAASVTGNDDLGNTWTITTVGTTSYTASNAYYQVGSGSKPATSITFTTTLPSDVNVTAFSAKFGGFNSTAGAVTLKVDDTSVGTGSLNATSDVTISNSSQATGKKLTVTLTGIAKGVKVYYISYTYTTSSGGSEPETPATELTDDQFAWSAATAEATMGASNTFPTLTNTLPVSVTYESSNTAAATIAADGTITLVAPGTTTISAKFAGGEVSGTKYAAKTVTYTLTVKQLVSCADIYDLADDATFVLKDFVVTYVNGKYTYIKDNTGYGYGLIYKDSYGLNAGDQVASGKLEGKRDSYNGLVEIIPTTVATDLGAETGEAPAPDLMNDLPTEDDMNKYVKFEDVTFASTGFSGKKVTGTINAGDITFYDQFATSATFNTGKKYDVIGAVSIYNSTIQVNFISAEEVAEPTLNVEITNSDFGKVAINGKAERTLTLNGSLLTKPVLLAIEGDYFTLASNEVTPIDGNIAEAKIKITYKPTIEGTHTATLKITSEGVAEQTINLTGEAVQQHTVRFFVNGEEQTDLAKKVLSGNTLEEIPTATSCDQKNYPTFAGWASDAIAGTTDVKPTMLDLSTTITSDCNYYAVFEKATVSGSSEEQTETITIANFTSGDGEKRTCETNSATWTWLKNNASSSINVDEEEIRLYAKHSMTISPKDGCKISKIVVDINTGKPASAFADGGLSGATMSPVENTATLTPTNGDIVISQSTQSRVNSFVVTYTTSTTTYEYITLCEEVVPTCEITYDFADGEGECTNAIVEKDTEYTLCVTAPTKTGYTFLNWKDQNGVEYAKGATINSITVDLTLTAQWQVNSYEVTWMSLGEEIIVNSASYNTQPTKPATDPDYTCGTGKEFVGWTTQEIDGVGVPINLYTDEFPVVTKAITYYAVFASINSSTESTTHTLTPNNSWSGYKEGTITDDKGYTWFYCAAGTKTDGVYSLNLRNKDTETSYIGSPLFAANVKSIKATIVNGSTSKARKVYVCSAPTLEPTTGDLGITEVAGGHSGELSLAFEGTISQFYLQVSDALQFQSIVVEVGADPYTDYTTSCPEPVALGEGDNSEIINAGGTIDVKVNRNFVANTLYTLSLPFAMDNVADIFGAGTILYKYSSLTMVGGELEIGFDKVNSIEAGTPYLIELAQAVDGFTAEDVTITNTQTPITFTADGKTLTMKPVLTATTGAKTNGEYWLASDRYLYNTQTNLLSLRAVFELNVPEASPVPRARVVFNQNTATGMENVDASAQPVKTIINGQLFILRGEKMYDAQGKLVK